MRIGAVLALAAAPLLGACAGTAGAALRIRPAELVAGDTVEAQQLRIEDAVRDVAALGRLSCAPSGSELLACWPDRRASSPSPAFVSLHLRRDQSGYLVTVLESFSGTSGPRHLCAIQDRLVERIEFRGGGTAERDPKVSCSRKNAN
jgi:hypothetical protein